MVGPMSSDAVARTRKLLGFIVCTGWRRDKLLSLSLCLLVAKHHAMSHSGGLCSRMMQSTYYSAFISTRTLDSKKSSSSA